MKMMIEQNDGEAVGSARDDLEGLARVDAALLIPGRGDPLHNMTVIVDARPKNGIITHVGPTSQLPSKFRPLGTIKVPVLMPGLWDAHVHYIGAPKYDMDTIAAIPPALAGARSARDLAATLNAGFTSVRELAGYGADIRPAIEDGWIAGPNIYSAIAMLSITSGHADARGTPLCDYAPRGPRQGFPFQLCDGVDECVKAVRQMVRRGADCIKIATSGGATSADDVFAQQFSDQEVSAVVQEAARHNLSVAAHCHGIEGVKVALRNGCATLEHATEMDDDIVQMMKEKGTILVGTRSILEFAVKNRSAWNDSQWEKVQKLNELSKRSYRKAVAAGVKIALGTDHGLSTSGLSYRHGGNGTEFKFAVDMGLTPLQAIEAGTANAAETLGKKAPKSGQVREGYHADLIALDGNPIEDISLLSCADRITHVWKAGSLIKRPGHQISWM